MKSFPFRTRVLKAAALVAILAVGTAAVSAGMQVFEYEHLNPDSAAWLIQQHHDAGVAIMTDSVFAADGAIEFEAIVDVMDAARETLEADGTVRPLFDEVVFRPGAQ